MFLPRIHAWTPIQRWLLIVVVAFALVSFGTLVYSYERHHRGPSETVLYGTWQSGDFYLQFDPGGTFFSGLFEGEEATPIMKGRWYAGGSNVYLRVTEDTYETEARRPIILHIVDIQPNELRIRTGRDDVESYKRVNVASPPASNNSRQPTAGGRVEQI